MEQKLILIAGGTASGKTDISNKLLEYLKNEKNKNVALLRMDFYYKDISFFPGKKVEEINWDSPDSVDWKRLKTDLNKLLNEKIIYNQHFNFNSSTYEGEKIPIYPSEYIILEGLFALYDESINQLAYKKFYIYAKKEICYERRIARDKIERFTNFNLKNFNKKWENIIYPMHKIYVEPTKNLADIILFNNKNQTKDFEKMLKIIKKLNF